MIGQLFYGPLANKTGINCALQVGILIAMVGIIISLVGSYQMSFMVCVLGRLVCALGAASGLACTFMILKTNTLTMKFSTFRFSIIAFTFGIGLAVFLGGTVTQYLIGWHVFGCY